MKKVTLKELKKDQNIVVLQKDAAKSLKGGSGSSTDFIVIDDLAGF